MNIIFNSKVLKKLNKLCFKAWFVCLLFFFGMSYAQREDFKTLVEKATKGDMEAQVRLATNYEKGIGVPQSFPKAVAWYEKAAEEGDVKSQTKLGLCYYYRKGVVQSYEKAAYWFQKAAEQGYAEAQSKLGVCYHKGQGVKQSDEQAVLWFQKAADQDLFFYSVML